MTHNTQSGKFECDRCGWDCKNGSVIYCVIVSDLDPENEGHVRNLHFCRDEELEDGTKHSGCDKKVLSTRNLEYHNSQKDS